MMSRETKVILGALIVCILTLTVPAVAGSITTFATGDTISAASLNANFTHIHNTMVGGHGARLVNSDVATNAAISHSKLATPALLPRAWAAVNATGTSCTSSPCTITAGSGVSSVTRTSEGLYAVNLTTARANTGYLAMVTVINPSAATAGDLAVCYVEPIVSTSQILVDCFENDAGAVQDTGFNILILDND